MADAPDADAPDATPARAVAKGPAAFALAKRWVGKSSVSAMLVVALGLCIMNGKQAVGWNLAIYWFGFYVVLVCSFVGGIMSICLTYGFSEMVSIVPFSGGCYGYVRCTLGPIAGFIAGIMEASKYILYAAIMVYMCCDVFFVVYPFDERLLPLLWASFFVLSVSLQMAGSRVLQSVWGLLALASLVIQLLFIFGAARTGYVEYLGSEENSWQENYVARVGGLEIFVDYEFASLFERVVRCLPFANFLFCGIDAVRTCANDQSNKVVPRTMVFVDFWTTFVVISIVVAARAYTMFTFELAQESYPYDAGLRIAFPLLDNRTLTFMTLPGVFGTALGFNFASGRQVRSMACSGLLPAFLAADANESAKADVTESESPSRSPRDHETKPLVATVVCSVLSFSVLCATYYKVPQNFIFPIIRMADLQTCIEAVALGSAFIVFRTRFERMERSYHSPVGIPGAVLMMAYFAFTFVTMLKYDYNDKRGLLSAMAILLAVAVAWYALVARRTQFYSKEEQAKFMKAYIVNASKRRRTKKRTMLGALSKAAANLADAFRIKSVSGVTRRKPLRVYSKVYHSGDDEESVGPVVVPEEAFEPPSQAFANVATL